MTLLRKTAAVGLAATMLIGIVDAASARPVHRHYAYRGGHHYYRGGGGDAAGAAAAGAALGLLGAGIAGAAAASDPYPYGYYGPGYGYYGPGYGYYGY